MVDHQLVDRYEARQVVVLVSEPGNVGRLRIVVVRSELLRRRRRRDVTVGTSACTAFGNLAGRRRSVAWLVVARSRRRRR